MSKNIRLRAQASIETTLALICLSIILMGSFKVYLWLSDRMARQQENYEASRVAAGSASSEKPPVKLPGDLDIFAPDSGFKKQ